MLLSFRPITNLMLIVGILLIVLGVFVAQSDLANPTTSKARAEKTLVEAELLEIQAEHQRQLNQLEIEQLKQAQQLEIERQQLELERQRFEQEVYERSLEEQPDTEFPAGDAFTGALLALLLSGGFFALVDLGTRKVHGKSLLDLGRTSGGQTPTPTDPTKPNRTRRIPEPEPEFEPEPEPEFEPESEFERVQAKHRRPNLRNNGFDEMYH